MKALIFNSGLGSRMGELTRNGHKSMVRLGNGESVFGRQLRLLATCGVTEVVVTSGPYADQLAAVAAAPAFSGLTVTFVPNERYRETNYIYSMHLAREHLDDDFLLLHGDLVFDRELIAGLLADSRPDLAMYNPELPQPEKDFKVAVTADLLSEVSVNLTGPNCYAFQPLYKLSKRALDVWLDQVAEFVAAGNTGVYAENALNEVWSEAGITLKSYSGHLLAEVDTPEDLEAAAAQARLFDFAQQTILDRPEDLVGLPSMLAHARIRRPLLVGARGAAANPVLDRIRDAGIDVVQFTGYSSNPKLEEVLEGLSLFHERDCDSIISIGGGSPIDVAKAIKLLAASGQTTFPAFGSPLDRYVPHLAVPTTAGTGSESTHFAVVYANGNKTSVAHDAMLPDMVLLDPQLLAGLPDYHKKASLLDALAQCVESIWAKSATEQSREYAGRGIALILDYLFPYFHKSGFDENAARHIQMAANLSGRAINLTKTTAPHAMSYQLTSTYGIAHGHAAALCLVGVWRYFLNLRAAGSPEAAPVAEALDLLAKDFNVDQPIDALRKLEVILEFLQVGIPSVRWADLDPLVSSVNTERLGNSPVPLGPDELRMIYANVLKCPPPPSAAAPTEIGAEPSNRIAGAERFADLAALHSYDLEILSAFDGFCAQHHLRYYLSEGSMLGAIRHGGFIPWDDDLDVMMPRSDYRRFITLALAGELPRTLNLDCYETNSKHWVFGAKIQMVKQTEFYLPRIAHLTERNGPYIDLFPVDSVSRTSGTRFRLQAVMLRTLRRALFLSSGRSRGLRRRPVLRIPLYLATRLVSTETIHRWVTWVQSEFNSSATDAHWANLCTYYPLEREVFPREWFGQGRRLKFETVETFVPDRAEDMLTQIYGPSYAAIPSLRVQRARSHAFAVDRQLAAKVRQAPPLAEG